MYLDHFGLNEPPFKITPDTRLFYAGGSRGAILDAIVYAITHGEGVAKVVGEVGSGKTMLCRMLEVRVPGQVEVVYIANPSLSPENILQAVAFEMHLPVPDPASRLQVMQALHSRLLEKHAAGRRVVVFVEEAQSMPLETLEEVRLLSNLETERDKLLQIVLFGQPELDRNLASPQIRQLRERITHSFTLPPLSATEVSDYVEFRLRGAGYRGPLPLTRGALRALARASLGLIRRINVLADKALLAAYAAGSHQVGVRHVRAAVRDSEFGREPRRWPAWAVALGGGLAGAAVAGVLAYVGLRPSSRPPLAGSAPAVTEAVAPVAQVAPGALLAASPEPADAPSPAGSVAGPSEDPSSVPPPATRDEPPAAGTAEVAGAAAPANGAPLAATAEEEVAAAPASPQAPAMPAAPGPATLALAPARAAAEDAGAGPPAVAEPPPAGRPLPALVAQRLEATRQWLASVDKDRYSIQLLMVGAGREQDLDRHLRQAPFSGLLDQIYVYRTHIRGADLLGILLGDFATQAEARSAIAGLPVALREARPFVRIVRDIRSLPADEGVRQAGSVP